MCVCRVSIYTYIYIHSALTTHRASEEDELLSPDFITFGFAEAPFTLTRVFYLLIQSHYVLITATGAEAGLSDGGNNNSKDA